MAIGIINILGFSSNLELQKLVGSERHFLGLNKGYVCDPTFLLTDLIVNLQSFSLNGLAHSLSVLNLGSSGKENVLREKHALVKAGSVGARDKKVKAEAPCASLANWLNLCCGPKANPNLGRGAYEIAIRL